MHQAAPCAAAHASGGNNRRPAAPLFWPPPPSRRAPKFCSTAFESTPRRWPCRPREAVLLACCCCCSWMLLLRATAGRLPTAMHHARPPRLHALHATPPCHPSKTQHCGTPLRRAAHAGQCRARLGPGSARMHACSGRGRLPCRAPRGPAWPCNGSVAAAACLRRCHGARRATAAALPPLLPRCRHHSPALLYAAARTFLEAWRGMSIFRSVSASRLKYSMPRTRPAGASTSACSGAQHAWALGARMQAAAGCWAVAGCMGPHACMAGALHGLRPSLAGCCCCCYAPRHSAAAPPRCAPCSGPARRR